MTRKCKFCSKELTPKQKSFCCYEHYWAYGISHSKESIKKSILTRRNNGKSWHSNEAKRKIGLANAIKLKGRKWSTHHHSGWVINPKTNAAEIEKLLQ